MIFKYCKFNILCILWCDENVLHNRNNSMYKITFNHRIKTKILKTASFRLHIWHIYCRFLCLWMRAAHSNKGLNPPALIIYFILAILVCVQMMETPVQVRVTWLQPKRVCLDVHICQSVHLKQLQLSGASGLFCIMWKTRTSNKP